MDDRDSKYSPAQVQKKMDDVIEKLDGLVAPALGLTTEDLKSLRSDCATDSFLKRIRPRYPGTVTRKQGFRSKLDSGARYLS